LFTLNARLSVKRNLANVNQHEVWLCSTVMSCLWKKWGLLYWIKYSHFLDSDWQKEDPVCINCSLLFI